MSYLNLEMTFKIQQNAEINESADYMYLCWINSIAEHIL